jgi:small conductance mechanosensitive channel
MQEAIQQGAQGAANHASDAMQLAGDTANEALQTAVQIMSTWGLQVIGAIALLIIGRWIAGRLRALTRRSLERAKTDPALVPFFSSLVYYSVLAAVVIAVLGLFGIETTSFVAILASAGLAVGLAMQGTLSNFSAGVMLLVFRPFRPGDYVEVAGSAGSVAEIGLFSTHLNTPDNVHIIVPNSKIFGDTIKNYAANETRRNDIVVGISYDDDIGVAIDTIQKVLGADERVLAEPAPMVAVSEMADSSVNIVVRPWCKGSDYWPLRFDLMRTLKERLEAAGCTIPFPQRDVHVHPTAPGGQQAA